MLTSQIHIIGLGVTIMVITILDIVVFYHYKTTINIPTYQTIGWLLSFLFCIGLFISALAAKPKPKPTNNNS